MAGTRLIVQLSFVLYAVFVTPFAWYLLTVQRASFPYHDIDDLLGDMELGPRCIPVPVEVNFVVPKKTGNKKAKEWVESFQSSMAFAECLKIEVSTRSMELDDLPEDTKEAEIDNILLNYVEQSDTGKAKFTLFFLTENDRKDAAVFTFGQYHHGWIKSSLLSTNGDSLQNMGKMIAQHFKDYILSPHLDLKSTSAQIGTSYRITFSLLNEDPGQQLVTWDFSTFSQLFLRKVLAKLSALADFNIESEELNYAKLSLAKKLEHDEITGGKALHIEEMRSFLSANTFSTWSLAAPLAAAAMATTAREGSGASEERPAAAAAAAAGRAPRLERAPRFLLFAPAPAARPLALLGPGGRRATAFAIHGVGGVAIYNPEDSINATSSSRGPLPPLNLTPRDLTRPFGYFLAQLRTLLGLPSTPPSGGACSASSLGEPCLAFRTLPSEEGVADWELDALAREWLGHHLWETKKGLLDIAELLRKMPQIEIQQNVAEKTSQALSFLEQSVSLAQENTYESLRYARAAWDASEAAYFDPTLVGQLYFGLEQELAVYTPLIAPVMIPLVLGLLTELRRYFKKQKAKKIGGTGKEKKKDCLATEPVLK